MEWFGQDYGIDKYAYSAIRLAGATIQKIERGDNEQVREKGCPPPPQKKRGIYFHFVASNSVPKSVGMRQIKSQSRSSFYPRNEITFFVNIYNFKMNKQWYHCREWQRVVSISAFYVLFSSFLFIGVYFHNKVRKYFL